MADRTREQFTTKRESTKAKSDSHLKSSIGNEIESIRLSLKDNMLFFQSQPPKLSRPNKGTQFTNKIKEMLRRFKVRLWKQNISKVVLKL